MGGRFGKYGDIKRKKIIRRRKPEITMFTEIKIIVDADTEIIRKKKAQDGTCRHSRIKNEICL